MRSQRTDRFVMVDRVSTDGSIEAEVIIVLPLVGGGRTFILDDGTELRFHRDEWAEVIGQPPPPRLVA